MGGYALSSGFAVMSIGLALCLHSLLDTFARWERRAAVRTMALAGGSLLALAMFMGAALYPLFVDFCADFSASSLCSARGAYRIATLVAFAAGVGLLTYVAVRVAPRHEDDARDMNRDIQTII